MKTKVRTVFVGGDGLVFGSGRRGGVVAIADPEVVAAMGGGGKLVTTGDGLYHGDGSVFLRQQALGLPRIVYVTKERQEG